MARSLRIWLSLGLSALVALAIVTLVAALLSVLLPRLNAEVAAKNHALGEAATAQIETFLEDSRSSMERLSGDIEAQRTFDADRLRMMVDTLANSDHHLEAVYVVDAGDRVLEVGLPMARRALRQDFIGADFSARTFVATARQSSRSVWSDTYLSQRGGIVVAVAVPLALPGASTGVIEQAMLVGELSLQQVSLFARQIGRSGDVLPIIVDRRGQVVGHPDVGRSLRQENLSHLALLRAPSAVESQTAQFRLDEIDYIGTTTPIRDLGWTTLIAEPIDKAFAIVRSTLMALAAASLAAFGFAVVAAFVVSRRMSHQVAEFGNHMQAIAAGDYRAFIPRSSTDEIEGLAQSMRRMATAVLDRESRLVASQELLQDTALHKQTILDSMGDGVITINELGVMESFNQAACRIFGYTTQEVLGCNLTMLMPEPHRNHHDAYIQRYQSTGEARVVGRSTEVQGQRKDGSTFPMSVSVSKLEHANKTTFVGLIRDITRQREDEEEIRRLAYFDALTGLPNRRLLMDRLKQAMRDSARTERHGALMFLDLDNFKLLNDSRGHATGDLLLQQATARLTACIREGDSVARLGGDEFVVLLTGLSATDYEAVIDIEGIAQKLLSVLGQSYQLQDCVHTSTVSIGIVSFVGEQETMDELLKKADAAMYQAKAAGRNTARFFDQAMQVMALARTDLETDLQLGVEQGQLLLHYQAQVVGAGRIMGVEALVRWQHSQRGLVPPTVFIPVAEESDLILPIGQWVLETACRQLAAWAEQPDFAHLTIAVNVSARQFRQVSFVDSVLTILNNTKADPRRLKLELTESMLVKDVEDVIVKMGVLKARGVSFSLDDFGTGYSSLAYLKRLPLDQLKIDQGFVRNVVTDHNDAAIAKMVVALAESMGLAVIAEGVELQAQADFLARLGCHAYQGYLFSRPLPLLEFEAFLRQS